MTEAVWNIRPYREGDIPAIVALTNAVNIAEGNEDRTTEADLQRLYNFPGRDPLRHILVVDGPLADGVPDGMLLGSGRAFPVEDRDTNGCTYELAMRVHPALKEGGLHRHIAEALLKVVEAEERRNGQGATRHGRRVTVSGSARGDDPTMRAVWLDLGLREVRVWYWMVRSSFEPIDEPKPVEGVAMRTYQKPGDNEAVFNAAISSFADHFGFREDVFKEEWTYWDNSPTLRPDLSWVAEIEGSGGKIAGLCMCDVGTNRSPRTGEPEALLTYVGTVREWRRKGLARNLMLHCLHSLREAGIEDVSLNVDSTSLTGANRLYESVGFRVKQAYLQYDAEFDAVRR